ncbi:MAG: DUF1294 domain-containing protein [Spirochaetales bacterium]|nr:DUF1294 domain-containing protein [Spirochaetales bacterium]
METKTIIYIAIAALLLILNLNSFRLMAKDKKRAQADKTHSHPEIRVPEKTLFLAAGLFGGLGGCLGMYLMRHKTKHWYFALFFPVFLILQTAALVLLYIYVLK